MAMQHTDTRRIDPSAPAADAALRELAGRIKKLSFREMLAFAGAVCTEDQLHTASGVTGMATRLLAAADVTGMATRLLAAADSLAKA